MSSAAGRHSPLTPQFVRLPTHPSPRPATPNSVYSDYSFYQLESSDRSLSPSEIPAMALSSDNGDGIEKMHAEELSVLSSSLPPQTPEQYLQLGIAHHEADRLVDSAHCFEKSATENGGCAVGMLMWGLSLRHAWGCEKDEARAFQWLKHAAEHAVIDLQRAEEGRDVLKRELVLAVYEVGQCFFHGWGVPRDKTMGVSYFRTAAQLGDPDAQQDLAFCLANGKGCKKDRKEAAKWYRVSAAQGASTIGLAWIYKPKYDD